jgi:predicted Zn-dependent protease
MGEVSGGRTPEFLSTHPSPKNRAETLAKLADKMMPYFNAPGERPSFNYQ